MSYCLYDPVGTQYLGDLASIGGWADFKNWAMKQPVSAVSKFVLRGATSDPQALATALHAMRAEDPNVESVRQQLAFLADKAVNALVLSNGTENALSNQ